MNVTPDMPGARPHTLRNPVSEMGRTRYDIVCPFCGTVVTAYLWSLAGSGKRCPKCRAMHGHWGYSRPADEPRGETK